jgi:hypothetical protein
MVMVAVALLAAVVILKAFHTLNARVARQVTHADAVAQDCAARERAGGVNGDDADRPPGAAIRFSQLGDERGLAGAGRAGDADDVRAPGARVDDGQRLRCQRAVILHLADEPRQRAPVSGHCFVN